MKDLEILAKNETENEKLIEQLKTYNLVLIFNICL